MSGQREDRSGIVLYPFIAVFCSAILSALLISSAVDIENGELEQEHYTSARNRIVGEGIHALAEVLGASGSVALAAAIIVPSMLWLGLAMRKYRREQPAS